ncbi:MAG: cyclopropane-fatty-acyl-phospholipid synthase [Alphaproteobacteria bacterium]|uniref:cyclopropane-fatty-acyl-phospholipid synthase family protein n=1 Tax=Aestuariivirga sp. TaxID=2650926 RepID=UPI0030199AC5|nr:cyclopropane-fatty-acyl-phospholipid synthase [Alphaproteobacteria bacterium]
MYKLLDRALKVIMEKGTLRVTGPDGKTRDYGDGTGTPTNITVRTPLAAAKIAADADLYLGECYMDGTLDVSGGTTIYDALALLMDNAHAHKMPKIAKAANAVRIALKRVDQYNPVGKAKNNVAHHYDLSGALYHLFLDRDRQYSCAYFETDDGSLEDAQLAKKRHLAAKLAIKPGMKVLDIGSGWGGLGLYIAEICGAEVTGVTLSEEQHKLSNERAKQRGVSDRVQFLLKDYRHLDTKFDRIVSVGMFEHVGIGHFKEFFTKVNGLLTDDGVAVLHSINRSAGPDATSAWIKKYIFPGGYIPALSEVLPHIEKSGLYVTDIEILRLHYAKTLRDWYLRFADHRERAKELYDERFCRMWEFYLAASECAFRYMGMNNFQIQFVKNQNALPLTRNYMTEEEDRLREIDSKLPRFKSVPAE